MGTTSSRFYTIAPLLTLAFSIAGCILLSMSFIGAFLVSLIPLGVMCVRKGFTYKMLWCKSIEAIGRLKTIFGIILLMGASISMWLSSGTVAYLMKMGVGLAKGPLFLPMTFMITAICSLSIGTALGTFSTIGMAFYGIGQRAGIDSSILVGVLLSGVFFADRLAPMSGLVNLTLSLTSVEYRRYFKRSLWRIIVFAAITAGIYYGVGIVVLKDVDLSVLEGGNAFVQGIKVSPILWIMPVSMVVLAMMGTPTIRLLGIGVGLGFLLTLFYQETSGPSAVHALVYGYISPDGTLQGGGIIKMWEVLVIVALAIVYNEWLGLSGITHTLGNWIAHQSKTPRNLLRRMGIFSMALTSLTCDQTVGILLPIETMARQEKPVNSVDQAILVSNTGTLIAPLESWNVNALIIFALTGVSAWQYAPWAVFCWLVPLGAIVWPTYTKKED